MTLAEISAALQRGEALTADQKIEAVSAMKAWKIINRDPFTSVDTALAFVAEVFPRNYHYSKRLEELSDGSWLAAVPFSDGKGVDGFAQTTAPTPSAAIMAACIEAHLAKGWE